MQEDRMSDLAEKRDVILGVDTHLDVHVAAVRRKLGAARARTGARLPEIATVRGHGYRLELG